jgi:3-oxoacyl-(acyl-carrier-protein) synthase III
VTAGEQPRLPASILGTGSAFPGRRISTRSLIAEVLPGADPGPIESRIGIDTRHWLEPGETAAQLAARAVRRALERAEIEATELRRIILVTSSGGDQMIPATANAVAGALGIEDGPDAFDLSNSCAGFLTGFDLAARSVATGRGPVAVVAVETFSRHIAPAGRRAYLVLGDGAAAAIVGRARSSDEGLVASVMANSGILRGKMVMPHPYTEGARRYHDFDTNSEDITSTAIMLIERAVNAALDQARLRLTDIDWVLPHQPNGEIFNLLAERLGIGAERVVPIYREHGSLGSASVPVSLDRLLRERSVRPGARVLMTAVGSGTAYGAIVYQVAR